MEKNKIELTDKVINLRGKVIREIKRMAPSFGKENQRTLVFEIEELGGCFEPKFKVIYKIYFGEKDMGKYQQILIFNKDYEFKYLRNLTWIRN